MRMLVPQRGVAVPVRVGLGHRSVMRMLMVFVVHVGVLVLQRVVVVRMRVPLRQV